MAVEDMTASLGRRADGEAGGSPHRAIGSPTMVCRRTILRVPLGIRSYMRELLFKNRIL